MTENSIFNTCSDFTTGNLSIDSDVISTTDTNGDMVFDPNGTGAVTSSKAIVPSGDRAEDLGTTANAWDNAYLDGFSFNDGTDVCSVYETGTFTPALSFGGGSTGITYSTQSANYLRIGDIFQFDIIVVLTSKGSDTGTAVLTGLSVTPQDPSNVVLSLQAINLTNTGEGNIMIYDSTAPAGFRFQDIAYTPANLDDTDFADDTEIRVVGAFRIA
jgi:hypothetical protein